MVAHRKPGGGGGGGASWILVETCALDNYNTWTNEIGGFLAVCDGFTSPDRGRLL